MKYALSARNQFEGTVSKVTEGAVNGIVTIDVNGTPVTATISMGSIKNLDIKPGVKACAVVKATEVMVGKGKFQLSARNQFPGKVTAIEEGAVNAIVKIEALGGNTVTSTISIAAVKELGLKVGEEATAVIKATSVMVGI
ncbi:MAG: TOBE domain-containing protein [Candidatus Riflebacteria bacterium]|nr:TOBE domain-containing protein [Candidatus Riflebacteria bacterium]